MEALGGIVDLLSKLCLMHLLILWYKIHKIGRDSFKKEISL
jgi:hypothetical protein